MFKTQRDNFTGPFLEIVMAAKAAARVIPPVFPLQATVAVNPYLGMADLGLADVAARMGRVGGVALTMPRGHYAAKAASGEVTEGDIIAALVPGVTLEMVRAALAQPVPVPVPAAAAARVPTVADLAAEASGIDWPAIMADRIGLWAASHFDMGQALWQAAKGRSAFDAWRGFAGHDLTPEIEGLSGFAALVAEAPDEAWPALARSVQALGISAGEAAVYFHALLHGLGGWAQVARWKLWEAELAGGTDDTITDLLAIRLIWEEALLARYGDKIGAEWAAARARMAAPVKASADHLVEAVLQEAAERAGQRRLAAKLADAPTTQPVGRPVLQAAFCIDVRSEVFRRALEGVHSGIETIGFAGFFGLPLAHRAFGSVEVQPHLPVLLNAAMISAPAASSLAMEEAVKIAARGTRAWGRFRQAAVSSFAFVEAAGPIYAAKLVRDALGLQGAAKDPDPVPEIAGLDVETRVATAAAVLGAMSMTTGFAPVVMLVGHGASVTNNPLASGLHCGACGGQTGEVSARALAGLLDAGDVRAGLVAKGITVPADTRFVAALHDTTTDAVTLYDADGVDLGQVRKWLAEAGLMARAERALRLPGAKPEARAKDWAQVRPEWALAGCSSFVVAPRNRTAGRDLAGRAFLHSYDWRQDAGFGVLELILTAPVVVASWISLQYYGSVVSPQEYGAGNKLLHNVVGGFGVLEGNGGAPRVGLAWQSVHDGVGLQHDPLRLSVVIEAPEAAMNDILARHDGVRALFDNRWLHLLAMDDQGRIASRYVGGLAWEPVAVQGLTAAS